MKPLFLAISFGPDGRPSHPLCSGFDKEKTEQFAQSLFTLAEYESYDDYFYMEEVLFLD